MNKQIKIGDAVVWMPNGKVAASGTLERVIGCTGLEVAVIKEEDGSLFKALMNDLVKVSEEKQEPKTLTREEFDLAVKKVMDYDFLTEKTEGDFDPIELITLATSGIMMFTFLREELFKE